MKKLCTTNSTASRIVKEKNDYWFFFFSSMSFISSFQHKMAAKITSHLFSHLVLCFVFHGNESIQTKRTDTTTSLLLVQTHRHVEYVFIRGKIRVYIARSCLFGCSRNYNVACESLMCAYTYDEKRRNHTTIVNTTHTHYSSPTTKMLPVSFLLYNFPCFSSSSSLLLFLPSTSYYISLLNQITNFVSLYSMRYAQTL